MDPHSTVCHPRPQTGNPRRQVVDLCEHPPAASHFQHSQGPLGPSLFHCKVSWGVTLSHRRRHTSISNGVWIRNVPGGWRAISGQRADRLGLTWQSGRIASSPSPLWVTGTDSGSLHWPTSFSGSAVGQSGTSIPPASSSTECPVLQWGCGSPPIPSSDSGVYKHSDYLWQRFHCDPLYPACCSISQWLTGSALSCPCTRRAPRRGVPEPLLLPLGYSLSQLRMVGPAGHQGRAIWLCCLPLSLRHRRHLHLVFGNAYRRCWQQWVTGQRVGIDILVQDDTRSSHS